MNTPLKHFCMILKTFKDLERNAGIKIELKKLLMRTDLSAYQPF